MVRGEIETVQIGVGRGWCLRRNRHGCAGTGVQRHRRGPAGAGTTRPGDDIGDDDRRKRYRDFGDRRAADVSRRTTYHYAAVDDNDSSPRSGTAGKYTEMELPEMNSKKLRWRRPLSARAR